MFTIGVCDDKPDHRNQIRVLCESYFAETTQLYEIIEFASGEEVLAYPNSEKNKGMLHVLFLDIEMRETNGLEVLRQVEAADWIWRIVFVSSHEEFVWETFSIKTLGFVRKPIEYEAIKKWLGVALRENRENTILEYTVGMQKAYKTLEQIYYFEASANYTYLHAMEEKVLISNNLRQWQKQVEDMPFVRIHKSYLINMLQVQKWENGKVTLCNGESLAVGRQFAKEAKERYLAFVKKQALSRM